MSKIDRCFHAVPGGVEDVRHLLHEQPADCRPTLLRLLDHLVRDTSWVITEDLRSRDRVWV
jgi:hypothetical protein